jgi:hypothetical protein
MRPTNVIATLVVAGSVTMMAGPAAAKVYNVVFAGTIVPVDCPESPLGHTMTWVNQNCTAVRMAPTGTPTLDAKKSDRLEMTNKAK